MRNAIDYAGHEFCRAQAMELFRVAADRGWQSILSCAATFGDDGDAVASATAPDGTFTVAHGQNEWAAIVRLFRKFIIPWETAQQNNQDLDKLFAEALNMTREAVEAQVDDYELAKRTEHAK